MIMRTRKQFLEDNPELTEKIKAEYMATTRARREALYREYLERYGERYFQGLDAGFEYNEESRKIMREELERLSAKIDALIKETDSDGD